MSRFLTEARNVCPHSVIALFLLRRAAFAAVCRDDGESFSLDGW